MVDVSIIIPTKNDEDTISKCLASIENLRFPVPKRETIIIDGNSTDNTVEIAEDYNCRVLHEDHGTISFARDLGIQHAKGDFIAFTDADCVVEENWLNELLTVIEQNEQIAAVGGPNITPTDDTEFAHCVGNVLNFLSFAGARYSYQENKIREIHHNPSCNSLYRADVLKQIGGFNHSLTTADDEEVDFRIREDGFSILYTPHARVYHYRKPSWNAFRRMAYTYAIGRAQAIKLHPGMGQWYHYLPSIVFLCLSCLLLLSPILFLFSVTMAAVIFITSGVFLGIKNKNPTKSHVYTGLLLIWFMYWAVGFLAEILIFPLYAHFTKR